jgi:RTX calcium-binding nonapeptide repeat (4 copies)
MAQVYGTNNSEVIDWFDGVTDGNDTIFGYDGEDWIFARDGNDILLGGAGPDHLDGGDGYDTASYVDSPARVIVNLATGEGHEGTAEGDTFFSIENLTGSVFNDSLTGNAYENVLSGLWGDDSLEGGGGADVLDGSWGADTASYAHSRRATSETTAPGASVCSTTRALSSAENRRRRPVPVIISSRRTVGSGLSVWSSVDTSRSRIQRSPHLPIARVR